MLHLTSKTLRNFFLHLLHLRTKRFHWQSPWSCSNPLNSPLIIKEIPISNFVNATPNLRLIRKRQLFQGIDNSEWGNCHQKKSFSCLSPCSLHNKPPPNTKTICDAVLHFYAFQCSKSYSSRMSHFSSAVFHMITLPDVSSNNLHICRKSTRTIVLRSSYIKKTLKPRPLFPEST